MKIKELIVVQKVWVQVSADYDTTEKTRMLAVTSEITVGEVMRWAATGNFVGRGMFYSQSRIMKPDM